MKYKVGDQVVIKTWKEMKEEFQIDNTFNNIIGIDNNSFVYSMEIFLQKANKKRVVTIETVIFDHYRIKENGGWYWSDYMIKGLESEIYPSPKVLDLRPEITRFELMRL